MGFERNSWVRPNLYDPPALVNWGTPGIRARQDAMTLAMPLAFGATHMLSLFPRNLLDLQSASNQFAPTGGSGTG